MLKPLNPIIHSELRLAILSLLIGNELIDFNYIKEHTNASSGNISVQINKLKDAEYIEVFKSFKGNFPLTQLKITEKGIQAFEEYVINLKSYIEK